MAAIFGCNLRPDISAGELIHELRLVATPGDYNSKSYKLHRVLKKVPERKNRYVIFKILVEGSDRERKTQSYWSQAYVNVEAGFRGRLRVPDDTAIPNWAESGNHLTEKGIEPEWAEKGSFPPDQYSNGYYSNMQFKRDKAFSYNPEYWFILEIGTPADTDHGRVVSYIPLPPCAKRFFKI